MDAVTKEYTATLFKNEIENRFDEKIWDLLRVKIKRQLNPIMNEVEENFDEEQLEEFKRNSVSELLNNLDIDEYEKIDFIKLFKDQLESKLPSCGALLDEACQKTCELVISEFRDNFVGEMIKDLSENGVFEDIFSGVENDELSGNKGIIILPYIKSALEVGMSEEKIQNIFGEDTIIEGLITNIVEELSNVVSDIVSGYIDEASKNALSDYFTNTLGLMVNQLNEMIENVTPSDAEVEVDKEQAEIFCTENDDNFRSKDQVLIPSKDDIVSTNKHIKLMSTENYPYLYPFEFFNPVQSLVYSHKDKDNNMVIGANTSAGKTIAAELLIDSSLRKNQRIIYLSPLKSLTEEKYDDWKKRYRNETISIMTGDYVLSDEINEKLWKSKIIVMTSEMMDSRTRKYHSEKNYWMKEVGLVIVDEAHILSTGRGHAVEAGIMRFTLVCPNARILFLSATMPNVESLGEWLTLLNKKETNVINSNWRPVELQMDFIEYPIILNKYDSIDYWPTEHSKYNITYSLVLSKPDEKFLVFVHSKNSGRIIENKLKEKGVKVSFHNADLGIEKRRYIEESFKDRENGIRVLVSTSTTAWGVNLPARNVIIVGVNRGFDEVDELDLIQMAGRAGRYGIDDEGYVYLLIPEGSIPYWKNKFNSPRPITSVLNNHNILAFHVLAEIQTNSIKKVTDLFGWYKRSLAFMQSCSNHSSTMMPISENEVSNLFEDLVKMEMIDKVGLNLNITRLGSISANLYYSPYDIYSWYQNFDHLLDFNLNINDIDLGWAIGNISSNESYIPKDLYELTDDYKGVLKHKGLHCDDSKILFIMAANYCLIGKKGPRIINNMMRALRYDIERITVALKMIDENYANWGMNSLWESLPERINPHLANKLPN